MNLHPIIQAYTARSDLSFDVYLEKAVNKENYLETVILAINKEMVVNSCSINKDLLMKIDQAVVKGHPDSNVYILFIYLSIVYCHSFRLTEKNKTLYSIGQSSLNEKIHRQIYWCMLHAKAMIRNEEGNRTEEIILMQEFIAATKESPNYYNYFCNYALLLASLGRLNELNENDQIISNTSNSAKHTLAYTYIKLTNFIMIGQYKEGCQLIEDFHKRFKDTNVNTNILKMGQKELNIISGDFTESNYSDEPFKLLTNVYKNLLIYNTIEATNIFNQLIEIKYEGIVFKKLIESLTFHIELCRGNKGLVRLLLKEKKEKGNFHYLDDLFYGRLYLLEKNYRRADESFTQLVENVNHFGAMNRLIFELQFAKEMSLSDILNLTQGWKITKKSNSTRITRVLMPTPKLTIKGVSLLIGNNSSIFQVKELIRKYAPLKAPVLITGETGTGKELVSRAIHDEGSNPHEPFLAINCGGLTDSLLQSELFGYVAGAFTGAQKEHKGIFEAAGKGTVFLDEFGDISPLLQVSLLRVLESNEIRMLGGTSNRKIECRIIMATNTHLQNAVGEKKFREDLYFRITRFQIRIPALRERITDLPLLIDSFLNNEKEESEKSKTVSKDLLEALSQYRWPGNVRELKNEIERLKILHFEKEILNKEDFPFNQLQGYIPLIPKLVTPATESDVEKNSKKSEKDHNGLALTSDYVVNIIQRGSKVERRISFLRELFKQYKKLTRSQIIEITKTHPSTTTKELQMLCDERFIVRRTPTKSSSTYYFEINS